MSGTGLVAEGVEYDDATVAMRWLSSTPTHVTFDCVEDVQAIHGHQGKTYLLFLDPRPVFGLSDDPGS